MTLVAKDTRLRPEVHGFLATSKRLLINGEWVEARSGRIFDTFDPATGEKLTDVAHAEAADVDAAVPRRFGLRVR
jgi:phenylacetaldehyde dehydrogenase